MKKLISLIFKIKGTIFVVIIWLVLYKFSGIFFPDKVALLFAILAIIAIIIFASFIRYDCKKWPLDFSFSELLEILKKRFF